LSESTVHFQIQIVIEFDSLSSLDLVFHSLIVITLSLRFTLSLTVTQSHSYS